MTKRYLLLMAFFAISVSNLYSQAPANDICANASPLAINGGYITVSNANTVTNGPNPSCGGSTGIRDIWFSFLYTGGNIVVETQLGTNTDTRIAVFTACGGTQLACNDDYGGTYRSYIALACSSLVVGNTYIIQAGGYNAVTGAFQIQVTSNGSLGCTDPMATNYSPCAVQNNGSCVYPILTAQFGYAPSGQNCLNIQYTSTSSGNITGYSWAFPGGSPATSTAQNPVVSYPSPGTYAAALTIADANGSDTETNNNVQITSGQFVTVDITPDANPAQTSWSMFNENDVVVASGNANDATFCVANTCHRFEIYDSAGNGLTGLGNYRVYVNGIQVANGASFSSQDIRYINCPDGVSCDNPLTATLGLNNVPFDNSWYQFTAASNGNYRISTCNLVTCDTKVWVYDYCNMAFFDNTIEATVQYNDDFCGVQAEVNMFLAAGETYYVRVGSEGSCAGEEYQVLFEYTGAAVGCMDVLACNYAPLAGIPGPCYYNGDPNCTNLGPDLLIDQASMFSSMTSTTLNGTDACLVNEGCLQGLGTRQIIRFTTRIANIGTQDYYIGVPNASNPQFEYDNCHNHFHYEGYAEYLLFNQDGQPLPDLGYKNGFCVLDLSCPTGITAQYGCGNMGITAGCADIYSSSLTCQWIDITDVPAGEYFLVIRTNWNQAPDALGRYELRYDNNWAQVCVSFQRNPVTNAVINFTKSITACPIIEDCLGTPFGSVYEDCEGNCPGVVIKGDFNQDGFFTAFDEHLYAEAAVNGGTTATPCNDLNADGEITIADAANAGTCIHQQQDLGVPPLEYTSCNWDPEFIDQSENVTLGLTNLNATEQYFDLYITNPQNQVVAFQVDLSGVSIQSIENLLPTTTWSAHLHWENNGNTLAVMSNDNSEIPMYSTATPLIRVYYSTLSGNTVCISNIIDVINDLNHNTLTTYGNCVNLVPSVVADFSASQTTVCAGGIVNFSDLSAGSPTAWSWSFAGGSPAASSQQNPSVSYNTPGTYSVTLTATGPGGSDAETKISYITVGPTATWYADTDADGYGNSNVSTQACAQPFGYVNQSGDCNDGSAEVNPMATEICDGIDNNCNGSIDEGFDNDNDGYTTCDGDCDDNNALAYPGAFELCNNVDENCNGQIDEGYDNDNDGYTVCAGDCNDNNAQIYPGAAESCNNTDDDCDNVIDEGFDQDNDGYTSCGGDCNDSNAAVNPGAAETCNNADDNCDGTTDEGFDFDGDGFTSCNGDCNDNNFNINPEAAELCNGLDDDCDGTSDEGFDIDSDGYSTCAGDCNDNSAAVNPAATEQCNGIDDDCDASVDEGFDNDSDGYTVCQGDCDDNNNAVNPGVSEVCNNSDDNCNGSIDEGFDIDNDGYTVCEGDCNDNNSAINPGATEVCNGADEDCDSNIDEGFDTDGDGYTTCGGDCNDASGLINPGAFETCNGVDDDCDNQIDENQDADNDGYSNCAGDCDDSNASVNPAATETCNGIDDDCDGSVDENSDTDGDGVTACAGDCNDNNALVYPGAAESCNGIDEDCDGSIDEGYDIDGDGYTSCGGDCNDNNSLINPGASESCNSTDDDCDGSIDEGFDLDGDGYTTCEGDCNDANAMIYPTNGEFCNGIDDNCNGLTDEGFDQDGDGFTTCGGDCNDNNTMVRPGQTELCNAIDDDCDGQVDDNAGPWYYIDSDGDGFGNPATGLQSCSQPAGYVNNNLDCFDNFPSRYPGALEFCNNADDDCDGVIDDNCSNVANDFYVNATALSLFPVTQCTGTSGTLAGATASAEAQSTVVQGGQDVWYKFVATEPGIRCRVTTTTTDVLVELQDSQGNLINVENYQNNIKGNEFLNYTGLTIGQTYYVAVRNNNSSLGAGSFMICINALKPGACFSSSGNYNICSVFKASSISASGYIFNFTSNTSGLTYSRTVSSINCTLHQVNGLPAGDSYTVRVDAYYNLTVGNGVGELLVVPGQTLCSAAIVPMTGIFLNASQDCPSARLLGSQVRTNTTVCAISNYEWEFQRADLSQPAFYLNGGTNQNITLSAAAGFALGQTYNVRIRSTLTNGFTTPWGPVACLLISSSGMVMESEEGLETDGRFAENQINIYPNPNKGDEFMLYVNEVLEGDVRARILDGMGREVWNKTFLTDSYLNTQVVLDNELAPGIYLVELIVDGVQSTHRMVVQK
jgi:PKD repeat protein